MTAVQLVGAVALLSSCYCCVHGVSRRVRRLCGLVGGLLLLVYATDAWRERSRLGGEVDEGRHLLR